MPESAAPLDGARNDVFIAHAGCDTDPAKKLYAALDRRGVRPYLDAMDLLLGDAWDSKLSEAQAQSAVTVVLVSKAALDPPGGRPAHYWLEEISHAIELTRNDPERHRVVPAYLKGRQEPEADVPYGLRRLNSLFLEDIDTAADALVDLLDRMRTRDSERHRGVVATAGQQHDLLIDVVGEELCFIHLSGGRIAESAVRYDPEALKELQEAAPEQDRYDERVAAVAARTLLPNKVRERFAALDDDDRLRFHLSQEAWPLPWELLLIGGMPLSLRCPTSRQPRGAESLWHRGGGVARRPKVLVFTSGSESYSGVRTEAEGVAQAWTNRGAAVRLVWDPDLLKLEEELAERCDVIHFAGHAWFERDSGESYLGLSARVTADDEGYHYSVTRLVEALVGSIPTIVCVNSHYTALVGPVFRPDAKLMPATAAGRRRIGFARPLLKAGVPVFVGTYGSPDDQHASNFGVQFNEELARGSTVGEAAFGGRHWARVVGEGKAWSDATVASYIVAGDADARVTDGTLASKPGTLDVVPRTTR